MRMHAELPTSGTQAVRHVPSAVSALGAGMWRLSERARPVQGVVLNGPGHLDERQRYVGNMNRSVAYVEGESLIMGLKARAPLRVGVGFGRLRRSAPLMPRGAPATSLAAPARARPRSMAPLARSPRSYSTCAPRSAAYDFRA